VLGSPARPTTIRYTGDRVLRKSARYNGALYLRKFASRAQPARS
jgi:hypothetical protein